MSNNKCPNCKSIRCELGICLNYDCYEDNHNENGYVVYCNKCYDDHLITSHYCFDPLTKDNKVKEDGRVNDV